MLALVAQLEPLLKQIADYDKESAGNCSPAPASSLELDNTTQAAIIPRFCLPPPVPV
jgi:hypothetical protein